MMTSYDQAEIAAILELKFQDMQGLPKDADLSAFGLEGFTFVDMGEFDREIYQDTYPNNTTCSKAVTIRGPDGSLYVHFNGTGDGNWGYNSAAYQDGSPSAVQEWSLYYFNQMVEEEGGNGDIYVSGHSQGGNNAQFVTMRSAYGERIAQCVSLDGPGFSNRFVEDTKNLYGEGYFESQQQKIYGYHGKSDFVSPLGQQDIIPEGHIRYLEYGNAADITYYHAIQGLFAVDENGNIKGPPYHLVGLNNGDGLDDSDFRKLVVSIAEKITEMPQDQQERAAEIVMKLCENMGGGESILAELTEQDLADLKDMLVPLLVGIAEENPDLLLSVLQEMGVDQELVMLAEKFLAEFNQLPLDVREDGLDSLLEFLLKYVDIEDGNISINGWLLAADVWDEIILDPFNAWSIIQKYNLDDVLVAYMAEHPTELVASVALAALAVIIAPKVALVAATLVAVAIAFMSIASAIIHLIELGKDIYQFVVNVVNAIKETINRIKEWIFKNSSGYQYAQENPYFRVDTDLLREYAQRLENLNRRLVQLDHDMDNLYPQVRLRDLISVFSVNWSTSWSLTLARAARDIRTTANELDAAEIKACGYLGG